MRGRPANYTQNKTPARSKAMCPRGVGGANANSELQGETKLNLPGAADGFVHVAQTEGAIVETAGLVRRAAIGRQNWKCSLLREPVVILILFDVVDGNVETGRVGHVENVKAEAEHESLVDLRHLHDGHVQTLLPGLPENVALACGEARLIWIVRRNGPIQSARLQKRKRKAGSV
jgi:hypothetical protein